MPLIKRRTIHRTTPSAEFVDDSELGRVKLISNNGRYLRINIRTNGEIVVSKPTGTSRRQVLAFIEESRPHIRRCLEKLSRQRQFKDGDAIGRHHRLVVRQGVRASSRVSDTLVTVTIPDNYTVPQSRQLVHKAVAKALKSEAERYLPKRLRMLALKHGFSYQQVRLTFAKSRWGSCSSSGTISLNVGLMLLPDQLIDYVLLHELTHTKHMNHSAAFWRDLELVLPGAKRLRDQLRKYSPYI